MDLRRNRTDRLVLINDKRYVYSAVRAVSLSTACPTRYRTRHFFNKCNTNEDIATKFEKEYVRCVRNEEECVCSAPNCCDTVKLLKKCRVR